MTRDIMAPYRVGRTGNAELDDALARIENMRQSLDCAHGALEDGGRTDLELPIARIHDALTELATEILG